MKIRVEHEDGRVEVLRLKGGCQIVEGKYLDRLRFESGMEHFFTKDGFYDGWGGLADSQRAQEVIEAVESRREFGGDCEDDRTTTQ